MKNKLEAKDVLPNINRTQTTERAGKCRFSSLMILNLTFKLVRTRDQTVSSVWIWRKSVQRFPRYFIQKQNVTDSTKSRPLCSSLRAVNAD